MRFLVNNALPPRLARLLAVAGHDAVHVRDYALAAASDELILDRSMREDRIILSAGSDFGTLLALMEISQPSFVLL